MKPIKLLSFGEICWDIFGEEKTLGGAPLNLAAHAARQGAEAALLSAVGADALGEETLSVIPSLGVRTDYISTCAELSTGKTIVTLSDQGIPSYYIPDPLAYDRISVNTPLDESFDVLAFGTMALRGDHNRRTLTEILEKNRFSEIYTDLNIRPPFYSRESIHLCLSHATLVKISDEELPTVSRTLFGTEEAEESTVKRILSAYPQIGLLILTKGAKGAICFDAKTGRAISCPAEPAQVVSTVGAGDSFGATFLVHYLKTYNIPDALKQAAKISALVVASPDAVPVDLPRVTP